MALVLTVGGVARTSVLTVPSLRVEQIAGAFTSTCSFQLVDVDKDIVINAKDAVTLIDGGTTFFAGYVATVDYDNFGRDSRRIEIACQDYNILCEETIIDGSGGHSPFGAVIDEVIIDTLFDEYLPAINSHNIAGGGYVDGGHLFVDISFDSMSMRQMLDRICNEADAEWYVDDQLYLHYFIRSAGEASNLLTWGLSDVPGVYGAGTNLIENPSFEVNITDFWTVNGWVGGGEFKGRSAAQVQVGDYSCRVYSPNIAIIAADITTTAEMVVAGATDYSFSFYLYKAICTGTGRYQLRWIQDGVGLQREDTVVLDAGTHAWKRYTSEVTSPAAADRLEIVLFDATGVTNLTENELFFDGVQLEAASAVTGYFDGSMPFGTWTGVAHNSTSTRAGHTLYSHFENVTKKVDSTKLVNEVFVVGELIGLWYSDATSVAIYGAHQGIVVDNSLIDIDDIEDRGLAVLSQYAWPRAVFTIKTQQDGARAGRDIAFKSEMMDVNALTSYTIKKLSITWPQAYDSEIYEMDLGGLLDSALRAAGGAWTHIVDNSIPSPGGVPLSSRGWTQALGFSVTDHDTLAWAGGSIVTADGHVFTIVAGNTGNVVADTFIFLDAEVSIVALQTTTNVVNAVGTNRILIAFCTDNVAGKDIIWQAFGGAGQGVYITADHIAANTITTNEIAVNTITAGNIAVGTITATEMAANSIDTVELVAGAVTADKLSVGMVVGNLCDCSVFRDDEAGEEPNGWTGATDAGGGVIAWADVWVDTTGAYTGERGTYVYYGRLDDDDGNGYIRILQDSYIPVDTGEIYTLSAWAVRVGTDPNAYFGIGCYTDAKVLIAWNYPVLSASALTTSPVRYDEQITGEGAGVTQFEVATKYIRIISFLAYQTAAGVQGSMIWNIQFEKGDYPTTWRPGAQGNVVIDGQSIQIGIPGGTRIEIAGDYLAGYSDATTKEFYLDATDGVAYAGAGAVVLDGDGISLVDNDAGAGNSIKWMDGGDRMAGMYAFYPGGAFPAALVIKAYDDGDPWAGAIVYIEADDGGDIPVMKLYSTHTVIFDYIDTFTLHSQAILDHFQIAAGEFHLKLGDAVGAKNVYIEDSNGATAIWMNSDGDAGFDGDVGANKFTDGGGGYDFFMPNPAKPNEEMLRHWAIETDGMRTLYTGLGKTDSTGLAVIKLPDWFDSLARVDSCTLTPVGGLGRLSVSLGTLEVESEKPLQDFCWLIVASRIDPIAQKALATRPIIEPRTEEHVRSYWNEISSGEMVKQQVVVETSKHEVRREA